MTDIVEKTLDLSEQQKDKTLKILTPKQMLQRFLISLAQLKSDNTSKKLINEVQEIMYSLYQANKITKNV